MRKKGRAVPEWLNSPIWSAPPPVPAPPDPYGTDLAPPPPPKPPPPSAVTSHPMPPPPPSYEQAVGVGGGRGDEEDDEGAGALLRAHLLADFKAALSKKVVNIGELRRLACLGVPGGGGAGVRPVVWKLLLGYLPTDRALWHYELEKKRSQYSAYKEEFLLNPSEKLRRIEETKLSRRKELNIEMIGYLPRLKVTNEEHPLSSGKSSLWNQYFQDSEILEQIDRDVKRTHPEISFFSTKSNQESLRRILIIFSKLNPTIRYVQGMNEVLAPLFYVFKNDPDPSGSASAEADTYFCFVELLSAFRDNYCKHLDNSSVGIRSTLSKLSQLLKRHDEELWRHMEVTTKVYPQYYAFRWITLLLTMEFSFNVCIHIWDAILGDPEGPPDTLMRICCAMLILVRKRLLAGDFTANIQLLQHYPATNIDHLLHIANRLRGTLAG
ncbi:hypothetical protein BS78_05G134300 [Paspalum vaginatum]|nr:hypothetical protein BS78_05G134300 [Paspalum vaginatum]